MVRINARVVSLWSGLSLVLACGFDSGGVAGTTSESGGESGSPGSGATLEPTVTASATASMSASATTTESATTESATTTDATADVSGTTDAGSGDTDPATTGRSETSSAATTGDVTTTDDPNLETSSETGQREPLYGPCITEEDCSPGAQCVEFFSGAVVTATVCYESCDMVDCPDPPGGEAPPICVDALTACGLDCALASCPFGMQCYDLANIGWRCGWPT